MTPAVNHFKLLGEMEKKAVGNTAARRAWELAQNNPDTMRQLLEYATTNSIYPTVSNADGEKFLHLAAVFRDAAPGGRHDFWHGLLAKPPVKKFLQLRKDKQPLDRRLVVNDRSELNKHDRAAHLRDKPQYTSQAAAAHREGTSLSHIYPYVEKLKHSRAIPIDKLPVDPGKFVYRGTFLPVSRVGEKNLFFSGHADVSSGYGNYLSRVKPHQLEGGLPEVRNGIQSLDVSKNFFTPHVAKTDTKTRIAKLLGLRSDAARLKVDGQVRKGKYEQKLSPFFEIVANPKTDIKASYKIVGDKAVPTRISLNRPAAAGIEKSLSLGGDMFPGLKAPFAALLQREPATQSSPAHRRPLSALLQREQFAMPEIKTPAAALLPRENTALTTLKAPAAGLLSPQISASQAQKPSMLKSLGGLIGRLVKRR